MPVADPLRAGAALPASISVAAPRAAVATRNDLRDSRSLEALSSASSLNSAIVLVGHWLVLARSAIDKGNGLRPGRENRSNEGRPPNPANDAVLPLDYACCRDAHCRANAKRARLTDAGVPEQQFARLPHCRSGPWCRQRLAGQSRQCPTGCVVAIWGERGLLIVGSAEAPADIAGFNDVAMVGQLSLLTLCPGSWRLHW